MRAPSSCYPDVDSFPQSRSNDFPRGFTIIATKSHDSKQLSALKLQADYAFRASNAPCTVVPALRHRPFVPPHGVLQVGESWSPTTLLAAVVYLSTPWLDPGRSNQSFSIITKLFLLSRGWFCTSSLLSFALEFVGSRIVSFFASVHFASLLQWSCPMSEWIRSFTPMSKPPLSIRPISPTKMAFDHRREVPVTMYWICREWASDKNSRSVFQSRREISITTNKPCSAISVSCQSSVLL